jgi:ATP-dependent DNA helicase RecQ
MTLMRPQNNGDLSLISGIGESKRAKYGAAFLAVIQKEAI